MVNNCGTDDFFFLVTSCADHGTRWYGTVLPLLEASTHKFVGELELRRIRAEPGRDERELSCARSR